MTFSDEIKHAKYFVQCTSTYTYFDRHLVARVWQRNLDYVKNFQAKYFTGENNIPIYGTSLAAVKFCNCRWQ